MAEEETKETSEPKKKDPKDMGWHEWADYKVTKLDAIDIRLIKAAAFFIGLPVGAYLHVLNYPILPYWWVFIVLALVLYIRPIKHFFGEE